MRHRATGSFWRAYGALPNAARDTADKNYALLKDDPCHPSLRFKKITDDLWSARVGRHYRALAYPDDDGASCGFELALMANMTSSSSRKPAKASSGHVFADIGLPELEQELLRAKLTLQIDRIVKARKLTQAQAAKLLGTTQPQMSALMRLRPVSISVGRLMEFLTVLGQGIEVRVQPAPRRRVAE